MRIPFVVTIWAALSGSALFSHAGTNTTANPNVSVPRSLSDLRVCIAAADRVIVTNWAATQFQSPSFSISMSGDKLGKIIKAVSTATRHGGQEHPNWEYGVGLQFYSRTNLLATIYSNGEDFLTDGVCRDDTGVLALVKADFVKREYYAKVYKDEEEDFAATKKMEATQWLKEPAHSVAGMNKKKVHEFVNAFYVAGACKVWVADIEKKSTRNGKATEKAKMMIVVVPRGVEVRRKLFVIHWRAVKEWGIDADDDVGQKYLWYESGE